LWFLFHEIKSSFMRMEMSFLTISDITYKITVYTTWEAGVLLDNTWICKKDR
jgi:hypothetical protein